MRTEKWNSKAIRRFIYSFLSLFVIAFANVSYAISYNSIKISAPGGTTAMSNNASIAGPYNSKCVKVSSKPNRFFCYYAPWTYNGRSITKYGNAMPSNIGVAVPSGINDSLDMVGTDYYSGGWTYLNGVMTSTGSLKLLSVNNAKVAVGSGQGTNSLGQSIEHAFIYQNSVASDLNAFGPDVMNRASSISDNGVIAGWMRNASNDDQSFVYASGTVTLIPKLAGATTCYPEQISRSGSWVAGICGNRGYLFNTQTSSIAELLNIDGTSGGVQIASVNNDGNVVGNVITSGKLVTWNYNGGNAIDLSSFAPAGTILSYPVGINDAGVIASDFLDGSYNRTTYLLNPIP